MDTIKRFKDNLILGISVLFFIVCLTFTSTTVANDATQQNSACYICSLSGCQTAAGWQDGALICGDEDTIAGAECELFYPCYPTPTEN